MERPLHTGGRAAAQRRHGPYDYDTSVLAQISICRYTAGFILAAHKNMQELILDRSPVLAVTVLEIRSDPP